MGKWQYGVVLDAGSSGTRLYVYRWKDSAKEKQKASPSELSKLPAIETKEKWTKKIKPGLSTFNETPNEAGPYLDELLKDALKIIPSDQVKETPFFLLATAGMRLLEPMEQKAILNQVCTYVKAHTDFLLPDCGSHIQIIDGDTEGLYGWISANYLLGGFNEADKHGHGGGHHTYGFLDMGGASSQIAFAPNSTEAAKHANDLRLLRLRTLDGEPAEYGVFVHSWLGFGVNQARSRYVDSLRKQLDSPKITEYPDPCLPEGLRVSADTREILDSKTSSKAYLQGTGKFTECLRATLPLLGKDVECEDEPCLFNGVHVPAIDFDVNHFVGVSEYWHTTHQIFEFGYADKAYDFQTYQQRVNEFCSQPWSDIQKGLSKHTWGKKVDTEAAAEVCFKASWLINVLHDGIGVPRAGLETSMHADDDHNTTKAILESAEEIGYTKPFQAVNDIHDTEVSWTLGKMVLYASSLVAPAHSSTLPVGFGSNVKGIPDDFQYPGGNAHTVSSSTQLSSGVDEVDTDTDSDDDDWKHKLLRSDLGGRTPGLLLLLLIVVIVALLLCGRERRSNLFRKVNPWHAEQFGGSTARRRRGFASKIPFLGGGKDSAGRYERVMEEGELANPGEFELNDVSSEEDARSSHSSGSSSGAHNGRARMTTRTPRPTTPRGRPGVGLSGGSGYFSDSLRRSDSSSGLAQGNTGTGLGISGDSARRSPALQSSVNKETVD